MRVRTRTAELLRGRRSAGVLVAVLALLSVLAGAACATESSAGSGQLPATGALRFAPRFPAGVRLVSNDFAYYNPGDPSAVISSDWLVTSGSLFSRNGVGWTGVPDSRVPNAGSTNGTGSAIFRIVTRERGFRDVAVSFDLLVKRLVTTPATPAEAWDGVHVFLHYQNQFSLYVVSVIRRDGSVVVKKKSRGGPSNGGTYQTLGQPLRHRLPLGHWEHVEVTIGSSTGGARITLYLNGRRVLAATDRGTGDAILGAGRVGLRGDNANFEFAHFQVRALG